jgi:hypothetical protein
MLYCFARSTDALTSARYDESFVSSVNGVPKL